MTLIQAKHLLLKFIITFLIFGFVFEVSAQTDKKYVAIELVADQTQVVGGETITVGVVQNIEPKWHVYWINPGDSGEATEVYWSGLTGLSAKPLQWPIPHKIPFGPLTNYGYEDQVVLLQELTIPNTLPEGPIELVADISLLVCEEICLPEFHEAKLLLNGDQAASPDVVKKAQLKLPISQDWAAYYSLNGDQVVVDVNYDAGMLPLDQMTAVELFFKERGMVNNSAVATSAAASTFKQNKWQLTQKAGDVSVTEIPQSVLVIVYQDPSGQRNGIELKANYQAMSMVQSDTSFLYVILGWVGVECDALCVSGIGAESDEFGAYAKRVSS